LRAFPLWRDSKKFWLKYGVKPSFTAQTTFRSKARSIQFVRRQNGDSSKLTSRFDVHELRGPEQNPDIKSKWSAMAREGKKVMLFLDGDRYVAVVVDGKMKMYG